MFSKMCIATQLAINNIAFNPRMTEEKRGNVTL